jgi:hypothetical protein
MVTGDMKHIGREKADLRWQFEFNPMAFPIITRTIKKAACSLGYCCSRCGYFGFFSKFCPGAKCSTAILPKVGAGAVDKIDGSWSGTKEEREKDWQAYRKKHNNKPPLAKAAFLVGAGYTKTSTSVASVPKGGVVLDADKAFEFLATHQSLFIPPGLLDDDEEHF